MKRDQEDYNDFNLYKEVLPVQEEFNLTNEQLLLFGTVYNLTSKGKRYMENGIMRSAFKKILKQHMDTFKAQLGTRSFDKDILNVLRELVTLGALEELQSFTSKPNQWGKTTIRYNFIPTDGALRVVNTYSNRNNNDVNPLF